MDQKQLQARVATGLAALALDSAHAEPLTRYLLLLQHWNRSYNLTAVRDPAAMVDLHLLDSLTLRPYLDGVSRLADLGAGAGLPGIPLAMTCPTLQVWLIESNGKKARFLREAARLFAPNNAHVLQSRIEDVVPAPIFDVITARALATLPQIIAMGGHLLGRHGRLLAMKGTLPQADIAALPPGWQLEATYRLHVPGLNAERHLVVVEKA